MMTRVVLTGIVLTSIFKGVLSCTCDCSRIWFPQRQSNFHFDIPPHYQLYIPIYKTPVLNSYKVSEPYFESYQEPSLGLKDFKSDEMVAPMVAENQPQMIMENDIKEEMKSMDLDLEKITKPKPMETKQEEVKMTEIQEEIKNDEKPKEMKIDEKPKEMEIDEKPQEMKNDEKPKEMKKDENPKEMKNDEKPKEMSETNKNEENSASTEETKSEEIKNSPIMSEKPVNADNNDDGKYKEEEHHHHDKNAFYEFEYFVNDKKTKDVKHQREVLKGDKVEGEYSLLEGDGNVRTVKYTADWKNGFQAKVYNSKKKQK